MWSCKHCEQEFDFKSTSEKANHSRWCVKNPKRNDTQNLTIANQKNADEKYGKIKTFSVNCSNCETDFEVEEREKSFPSKENYFCNRSCANSVGGKTKADLLEASGEMKYRSIAERNHEEECIVCGFDKIVEAHHVNEIHDDNRKENIVFLCPNHHKMFHSRYRNEVEPFISKYIIEKWETMGD